MLYILSGRDDYSLSRYIDEIKAGLGGPAALEGNLTVLEGGQVTVDSLRPVCEAAPFLAERRLVIIRGLMQRFQAAPRSARPRSPRSGRQVPDHQPLAEYLPTVPESTIVVMVDEEIRPGNPLFKALSKQATVKSFPLLRDAALRTWVQRRVREEGGSIAPEAVDMLVQSVGSNLWAMAGEVDKLLLYAGQRRIEPADVEKLVGYVQEANIFNLVDAIMESRAAAAERALTRLLGHGAAPGFIVTMLARQLRLLILTREVASARTSPAALQSRLNLASEFVARKLLQQARAYTMVRLKQAYSRLLQTDIDIKTSRYSPELALGLLVAELCQPQPAA